MTIDYQKTKSPPFPLSQEPPCSAILMIDGFSHARGFQNTHPANLELKVLGRSVACNCDVMCIPRSSHKGEIQNVMWLVSFRAVTPISS